MNESLIQILFLPGNKTFVSVGQRTKPPQPLVSDYIEVGVLVLIFVMGLLTNARAFYKLLTTNVRTQHSLRRSFWLLEIHLTISNLLVLFMYCPVKVMWLLTYHWIGGNIACKLFSFMWMFSFQLSSNIVVCIAVDRMNVVKRMCSIPNFVIPSSHFHQVKCSLLAAWLLALVCSCPQLVVWSAVELLPNWAQCTTVWNIKRFFPKSKTNILFPRSIYEIFHLAVIFWLPFCIILSCYIIIGVKLIAYANTPLPSTSLHRSVTVDRRSANELMPPICRETVSADVSNPRTAQKQQHPIVSRRKSCSKRLNYNYGSFSKENKAVKRKPHWIQQLKWKSVPHSQTLDHVVRYSTRKERNDSTKTTCSLLMSSASLQATDPVAGPSHYQQSSRKEAVAFRPRSKTSLSKTKMLIPKTNVAQSRSFSDSQVINNLNPYRPLPFIPPWRSQMKSKMFKITAMIVICYLLCCLPYNISGLLLLYDGELAKKLSNQVNWLLSFVLINSVINPILYRFPTV